MTLKPSLHQLNHRAGVADLPEWKSATVTETFLLDSKMKGPWIYFPPVTCKVIHYRELAYVTVEASLESTGHQVRKDETCDMR